MIGEAAITTADGRPITVARGIDRVQVTRGIACLLLVLFHVVGGRPDDGLRVSDGSGVRQLLDVLLYLRMPLFAFISGYVYALKPLDVDAPFAFLIGKFRRLGLPVLSATTIFFLFSWLRVPTPFAQTAAALIHAYLFSYEIYWFLQAMLLIFVAMPLLERFLLRSPAGTAVAVLATFGLTRPAEPIDFLSINGAMFLAPFFFVGIGARRFLRLDARTTALLLMLLIVATTLHIINVMTLPAHIGAQRGTWLSLIIGAVAPVLIIAYAPPSALLARIGGASFAIFLFHIFFVVPTRLALARLGLADPGIQFLAGMTTGVCGPVLLERLIVRSRSARRLLLGLR